MMIIGGQMYDATNVQVASLLKNRKLLRRALHLLAIELARGAENEARFRVTLAICDAALELESEGQL